MATIVTTLLLTGAADWRGRGVTLAISRVTGLGLIVVDGMRCLAKGADGIHPARGSDLCRGTLRAPSSGSEDRGLDIHESGRIDQ